MSYGLYKIDSRKLTHLNVITLILVHKEIIAVISNYSSIAVKASQLHSSNFPTECPGAK